jgi:hypothetical protein
MSWVLLTVGLVGCSESSDPVTVTYSHVVTVTAIELENVDNGQAVDVDGAPINGQVVIED